MTTIRQLLTRRLLIAFGIPLVICGIAAYLLIRQELLEQFESPRPAAAAGASRETESGADEEQQDELDARVAAVALLLAGCGGALLAVTFVVVPRIVRRAFAPVEALSERAAGINASSLNTRFDESGLPGELVPIAVRLNELLARLERSFDRERQFSADVAHELRTPIAELRNLAEVARKWPDTRSAEHDRDVEAISRQMEGIVSRLLALVRSESGALNVNAEPVDLVDVLKQCWKPIEVLSADRRLQITFRIASSAQVFADPVLVKSILTNVLQNAIEYSPVGGSVEVELVSANGLNTLKISNKAKQLQPSDVSHLFDRFWRHDASRTGTNHAGLGLPLARSFAASLGGELDASLVDGVLTMTFTLPEGRPSTT